MKKVTLELDDTVYELLQVLDARQSSVEAVIETLIDHAQQGVYRPGSWERDWLRAVFIEQEWIDKLEPGDPYDRSALTAVFQRPRRKL